MNEILNIKMLDSYLQKLLQAYGATPGRDPEAARRTQAGFLEDLARIFVEPSTAGPAAGEIPRKPSTSAFRWNGHSPSLGRRTISYALIALVVFGVFLFGGVGMTAYAASYSLPGDPLYAFKTVTENVQAGWAPDPAAQAHLYLSFAGRRLIEIQALAREGRFADLEQGTTEFEKAVQKTLVAVDNVSRVQPAKALALRVEIAAVLRSDGQILTELLVNIPGEAEPVVLRAIRVAISTADSLDPGRDDGSLGGQAIDTTCDAAASARRDDHCGGSSQDPGSPIHQTPEPSPSIQSGRDDDNNSNNGSTSGDNDDNDDGDDDDNDDDD
ncbi:MAG TPA: DUF5667 domain-containing protein [Anaerolineales bacterium]|nr:DUF5667 domain-containing protein [Anaerolineales bacterium]